MNLYGHVFGVRKLACAFCRGSLLPLIGTDFSVTLHQGWDEYHEDAKKTEDRIGGASWDFLFFGFLSVFVSSR